MQGEIKAKHCPPPPERGMIGPRIGRVSRISKLNFNKAVAEEGLFSGQHHIIMLLKEHEKMTVSEIAQEIGVAYSTASVSLKRLEKAGFVSKLSDSEDARKTYIVLTKKGDSVPENIKKKLDSQEEIITKGMTTDEIMLLSDLLDKIFENYEGEVCKDA